MHQALGLRNLAMEHLQKNGLNLPKAESFHYVSLPKIKSTNWEIFLRISLKHSIGQYSCGLGKT